MKIAPFCFVSLVLSASTALAAPQSFADPEAAAAAVVEALEAHDREALMRVFGPESEDVVISGDDERDRADREAFLAAYHQMNRVAVEDDRIGTLYIGAQQWPFPIPVVKGQTGWSFDVEAGREEMLARRIGPQRARRHRPAPLLCARAV